MERLQEMIENLFGDNRLSYRRLLGFVLVEGIATWLILSGQLDGDQWVSVTQWVGGIFIGAEGLERGIQQIGNK